MVLVGGVGRERGREEGKGGGREREEGKGGGREGEGRREKEKDAGVQ